MGYRSFYDKLFVYKNDSGIIGDHYREGEDRCLTT